MPDVARQNDTISHGGSIISGSADLITDNLQTARVGDPVHCDIHGLVEISSGSSTVFDDNKAVARLGDAISCGATITSASSDVVVG